MLDVLLVYLEEVGVKSKIQNEPYHASVIFNDGTIVTFWNANKWYAWMSSGTIKFSNGKELRWSSQVPSYEVLYKFKMLFENDSDYSEYLSTKLARKIKLKKLNNVG